MQDFSKLSGLKYNRYLQEYIYYSNKGYTQKNTYSSKSADSASDPAKDSSCFEKNPEYLSQANFIKSLPPR